jgi:hypothetical protein
MTEPAPPFFVPDSKPGNDEEAYEELAAMCNRGVPARDARIYSITYAHDGTEWTATVGEQLHGIRRRTVRSRGRRVEREQPVSDSATVLAIFAGVPYVVVTNAGLTASVRSTWVNPFMAGIPKAIRHSTGA